MESLEPNRSLFPLSRMKFLNPTALTAALGLATLLPVFAATKAEQEAEYYPITTLPVPEGVVLEAGAIQVLPDQRIAVSTRLGEIWFVANASTKTPPRPSSPASPQACMRCWA